MKKNINRVLVTAIGSFAADVVITNLKKQSLFVAGCDIYPKEWVAQSLDVDVFVQAEYASREREYLDFLLETCEEYKIQAVIPLTDVEVDVLNRNRGLFAGAGILVTISNETAIGLCRDKYRCWSYLSHKHICRTIPTWLLDEVVEDIQGQALTFPVVVKPCDGRSSQGLRRIKNEREFRFFVEEMDSLKDFVIQPSIQGEIVTVDILRQPETDTTVCLPRRELLRTLNGAGTSVFVFRLETLEETCRAIARALDVRGCVNFEFIRDMEGNYHFLECNPRFSGGVAFSCMAGYDMVKNHLNCYLGLDVEGVCQAKDQFIARKYHEYVTKKENV